MLSRVYAITLTAFRESIRDRILFAVLGVGAASLFFGLGMGSISYSETLRIITDHGLLTASLLGNLIAIFLGANFLYKELELRTLYVLLSRPLDRHEVILGKYLGILMTVAVFLALTASLLLVLLTLTATEDSAALAQRAELGVGWLWRLLRSRSFRLGAFAVIVGSVGVAVMVPRLRRLFTLGAVLPVTFGLFAAFAATAWVVIPSETLFVLTGCLLIFAEVAITGAAAMLFSSFSTPFVTGMLTAGFFAVGRSTWLMHHLPRRFPAGPKALLSAVAKVMPNLHLFVPDRNVIFPDDPARSVTAYLLGASGYSALYTAVLLGAAAALFRRRDLT